MLDPTIQLIPLHSIIQHEYNQLIQETTLSQIERKKFFLTKFHLNHDICNKDKYVCIYMPCAGFCQSITWRPTHVRWGLFLIKNVRWCVYTNVNVT